MILALITAQLYSPSFIIMIDTDDNRLEKAKTFGAKYTINPKEGKTAEFVKSVTDGKGCDTVIEAVGVPATFETCQELVAPGGTIANLGVHGTKVNLHLENLWDRNICKSSSLKEALEEMMFVDQDNLHIAITTRLVDAVTTPMLLKLALAGKLDASQLITHREHRFLPY